jgi:hypothetical protein
MGCDMHDQCTAGDGDEAHLDIRLLDFLCLRESFARPRAGKLGDSREAVFRLRPESAGALHRVEQRA